MSGFLDELRWRGLLHQATDEAGLEAWLGQPETAKRRAYVGFDPTADSLTIGNLVPIMMLVHFQRARHEPVVVMGGGTGLIGDPSGKSAERQLNSEERVRSNVEAQRPIFERVWRGAGLGAPKILNNLDWLGTLGFLEVLRDVGKHFSVNMMIQKDSVRERLHARDQGISFTEFSYMVLQSYDFDHLFRHDNVTLQMGGSDQWGNIVAGGDLIRKRAAADGGREPQVFGATAPLVAKADGGKFGKTESGAVWLTPERTSPYAYYQFWLNAADADVVRYLKIFTLLPRERIAELEAAQQKDPAAREAQRVLAREATTLLHGREEAERAEHAGKALFTGELSGLPEAAIAEVLGSAPSTSHEKSLLAGEGMALLDLLPLTTLAKSKSEARELLGAGSVTVNGQKPREGNRIEVSDLLHGKLIALRRGKKTWHVTRWG